MTLKKLRYEKGITQQQLANSLGVSRQVVASAEKNGLSNCSPSLVSGICSFFGVFPSDLLSSKDLLRFEPKSRQEAKQLIAKIKEDYLS